MKRRHSFDLLSSFLRLLLLVTVCTLGTLLVEAQERPLLQHEMMMTGRDERFLSPPELLKLREQGFVRQNPVVGEAEELGRMRQDYLRSPGHGRTPSPSALPPSRFHQNLQPTISSPDNVLEAWVARYDYPVMDDDKAYALAHDSSGNVYVAGSSIGSGTNADYATIKYNSAGEEQWVARYNGPGNGSDGAFAVAVDADGNVYVTGYSTGSGTSWDYATIKYDASGQEQWVARYNGPADSYDYAAALAVDTDGNIYVTGLSNLDYATVKYNSAGVLQWVALYNSHGGYADNATDLAVDGSGNVYVTGWSGINPGEDFATIKYNSLGVEQWVARYNGPGDSQELRGYLALDDAGNVYVTGSSFGLGTNQDYATIKYNAAGVQQWVARYDDGSGGSDFSYDIAVDGSGNVYVTGSIGINYTDYATIKYNSAGVEQWVALYDGPGGASEDVAYALAVAADGNVYVTGVEGYIYITAGDYATIKYDASGVEQWVASYNGPGNDEDIASALAVDAYGNVYVTGHSVGSSAYSDYATIKYTDTGSGGSSLTCGEISNLAARCVGSDPNFTVQWRLNIPNNRMHTGERVIFDVNGTQYVSTIESNRVNSRATGEISPAPAGTYTITLIDPPGCLPRPFVVTCGPAESVDSEWGEAEVLWNGNNELRKVAPTSTQLLDNYPNPFNPSTTFRYGLSEPGQVTLSVYDMLGQLVKTIVKDYQGEGYHEAVWDGRNESGANVASGIYIYRITAGKFNATKRMLLIK